MKLLLIHTGGTIAMAPGPNGLTPKAGLLESAIAQMAKGAEVVTCAFDPLVDSAEIGPRHWNQMLDWIDAHPQLPVLLTHGTDTMAYTGAALSQALMGSGRRVVLCGSMVPLGQGGDAEGNLRLALSSLGGEGVDLAFDGRLMPAAGLVKFDSHAADAFRSQPQHQIAPPACRRFDNRRLAILTLGPGLPVAALAAMLDQLDGAVLRVFGAGTIASDPALLECLRRAVAQGKRLRAVSQCEAGGLEPGAYAAGAGLWSAGVENGGSQTPEAALVTMWLG